MGAIDTAQIAISADFSATLIRASQLAAGIGATEVGVEHLLAALTDDADAIALFKASQVNAGKFQADVTDRIARGTPNEAQPGGDGLSQDIKRVIEAAAAAAKGSRRRDINGAIVLAAIVGDAGNIGAEILEAHGFTFDVAIRALQSTRASSGRASQQMPAAPKQSTVAALTPEVERVAPRAPSITVPAYADIIAAEPDGSASPDLSVPEPPTDFAANATESVQRIPALEISIDGIAGPKIGIARDDQVLTAHLPGAATLPPSVPVASLSSVFPQTSTGAPTLVAPTPSLPFPALLDPRSPAYASSPFFAKTALEPSKPRTAGAGYGLPPARPSLVLNALPHSPSASTEILVNIARGRPRPAGVQPPPIPAFVRGSSDAHMLQSHPAPASAPLRGSSARAEPALPSIRQPQTSKAPGLAIRGQSSAATAERDTLSENIPRVMRVGRTERVEIRMAKTSVAAFAEGRTGNEANSSVPAAQAVRVRLRAPEGGIFVEAASPETQWADGRFGLANDEVAIWRFRLTPQSRGWSRLQIIVSSRTVGSGGAVAEAELPDHIIEVKVRRNIGRSLLRLFGWTFAALTGGAVAEFGDQGIELAKTYAQIFLH